MRRRSLEGMLAVVLALAATVAVPARAAPPPAGFQALYDEYQKLGFIAGCSHRPADLRSALSSIPPDIEAYDPGFADALDSALEQQASGCSAASSPLQQTPFSAAGTTTAQDGSPGPVNKEPPGAPPPPEQADTSIPPALAALAGLSGALLLAAAGLSIGRRLGWGRGRVA